MTNQDLIRKLQSRIKIVGNAISDECGIDIPNEVIERQKLDKKLLAALYEAERVKRDCRVIVKSCENVTFRTFK